MGTLVHLAHMRATENYIEVTGNEIDDIVRYPLGHACDDYLSETMSFDIEYEQDEIERTLELCLDDWYRMPKDYAPDDNVPRELKNFRSFIRTGKHLSAQEASLILRYLGDDYAEERAVMAHKIPVDFARDIAVSSIFHTAVHTEKADLVPVVSLPIYREVQRMSDYEDARQAWIKTLQPQEREVHPLREAYWHELKRKKSEQIARESLGNASMLSEAYSFSLANAVKKSLNVRRRI